MKLARCVSTILASTLLACGYQAGLVAPEGTRTIGVEFFGNDGPLRDVEVQLQDELAQSIQRMVHLRLVDPARADLIVRGRVIDYSRRAGVKSPQNQLLETGVRITVEAFLIDPTRRFDPQGRLLTLRVLRQARTTTESGYRIVEPDGERAARKRAMRNLADRLALDLFGAVAYEPGDDPTQSQEPESY
ncbi:MAG TPA: LPS assembly lipoprotein LptE [Planctomycetota bacterium]|nr:LPS assembly lipoprotein LptE [Planctomycetota bacterium]